MNFSLSLQILEQTGSKFTRDNFSFSAKAIVGIFLQPAPAPYANDGEYIRMTDVDVSKRLEELKMFTRQTLNVEQRIEIARQQQAQRDAKKLAKEELAKSKEKARQARELEKNERLEAQRKERELKNQQAMEAKRKKAEELDKIRQEENQRKQQVNRSFSNLNKDRAQSNVQSNQHHQCSGSLNIFLSISIRSMNAPQEKEKKRQEAIIAKEQVHCPSSRSEKSCLNV